MSVHTGFDTETNTPIEISYSPKKVQILLIVLIFLAEMVAMVFLYYVRIQNYVIASIVDGLIMVVIILPILYQLQFKPLIIQIDERSRAEKALRSNEKMLRRILELLPVGVWILDRNGRVVHGNPKSKEIWAGARYVGMKHYSEYKAWWFDSGEVIQPDEWASVKAIAEGETIIDDEIVIETFDGTNKVILNSAVPILDENNHTEGAVVVNQDITQRRRMEEEIIETNELLEKYFNNIHTMIAYLDKDFNFIRVNEAYANYAGQPIDFFIGKNHFTLYPHAENQVIFQEVVKTGSPYTADEKPFDYPERGVTYWDWHLEPVKGNNDEVEGLVLSLIDVTERKLGEIQLAQQNQELKILSEKEYKQRLTAEGLAQAIININTSLEVNQVLYAILESVRQLISFQGGHILLLEGNTLVMASHLGYEDFLESQPILEQPFELEEFPLLSTMSRNLQPVVINQVQEDPDWITIPGLEWIQSYVAVPLINQDTLVGVLNLLSEKPGAFPGEVIEWLEEFAAPASLALFNARLFKAESTSRKVAETLSASAQALSRSLDLELLFETLLDQVQVIIQSDTAAVTLLEDEKYLAVHTSRGYGKWADRKEHPSFPIEGITDSVLKRVIVTHKSFVLPNTMSSPPEDGTTGIELFFKWLILPIVTNEKVIGLVELGLAGRQNFDTESIKWAEALVDQAAVAIQNAWLFQQVRSSSERLQSLARKLVEIQESERYRISRELHDDAGQSLSILKLNLGRISQDPDCPLSIRQKLEEQKQDIDGIMEGLHNLAINLRPITLDHLGLDVAIEQYARNFNSGTFNILFKAVGFEGYRLPKDLETCIYRIVQEAITNVIRHAHAKTAAILLERWNGKIKLLIEDDGVGFSADTPDKQNRLGLVGIRERAEMFGGSLVIESQPGKGTLIAVEVPDVSSNPDRR